MSAKSYMWSNFTKVASHWQRARLTLAAHSGRCEARLTAVQLHWLFETQEVTMGLAEDWCKPVHIVAWALQHGPPNTRFCQVDEDSASLAQCTTKLGNMPAFLLGLGRPPKISKTKQVMPRSRLLSYLFPEIGSGPRRAGRVLSTYPEVQVMETIQPVPHCYTPEIRRHPGRHSCWEEFWTGRHLSWRSGNESKTRSYGSCESPPFVRWSTSNHQK